VASSNSLSLAAARGLTATGANTDSAATPANWHLRSISDRAASRNPALRVLPVRAAAAEGPFLHP